LAEAIDKLLAAPTWARQLGSAARQTIDAHYAVPAMVQAIEEVYRNALQKRGV
jgi:glycosyltransferase involved in cell wall biosynthesis